MVRLELRTLFETGRVSDPPLPVLDVLEASLGLKVCQAPFPAVVREAEKQTWTRDPFDRLIVAQATLLDSPLASKDTTIHDNYFRAVWNERIGD